MSPFQLASSEFLDTPPLSAWIVINTTEDMWSLSERIFQPNLLSADSKPIEGLYDELNFHKRKWLLSYTYNPNRNNIMSHLDALRRKLDLYLSEYEHVILLRALM